MLGGREKFPRGTPADRVVMWSIINAEQHGRERGRAEFKKAAVAKLRRLASIQTNEHYRNAILAAADVVEGESKWRPLP